jgi:Protein of unknown function (DUF2867)
MPLFGCVRFDSRMKVKTVQIPLCCNLYPSLKTAYFYDSFETENPILGRSALQVWLDTVSKTPRWIEYAMSLRNYFVSKLGLKNLGNLSDIKLKLADEYKIDDRIGIFTLYSITPSELVLGDSDKHLDVKLSLLIDDSNKSLTLSTVVHVHNWLGRIYMVFVTPMHKLIVPSVLAKI